MENSNFDSLPAFLSTKDLVNLGLYINIDAAYLARLNGNSPDFIKFNRKILYKKADVIEFIEKHKCKGDKLAVCDSNSLQNNE